MFLIELAPIAGKIPAAPRFNKFHLEDLYDYLV